MDPYNEAIKVNIFVFPDIQSSSKDDIILYPTFIQFLQTQYELKSQQVF